MLVNLFIEKSNYFIRQNYLCLKNILFIYFNKQILSTYSKCNFKIQSAYFENQYFTYFEK